MSQSTPHPNNAAADLISQLREDWKKECSDLDTEAMEIVGRLIRLGRLMENEAQSALKSFNLSYTEFDLIATIRRSGSPYQLTPSELGSSVLLTSGAMTAALDRLQNKGLVDRVSDPSDRRVRAARLTPNGIKLAKDAARARFDIAQKSIGGLSNSNTRNLGMLLLIMAKQV